MVTENNSAQDSCQEVLQTLRSSGLIFILQESPYSVYITIRKRFRKDAEPKNSVGEDLVQKELDNTRVAHENLKTHYNNLKDRFEETMQECEA